MKLRRAAPALLMLLAACSSTPSGTASSAVAASGAQGHLSAASDGTASSEPAELRGFKPRANFTVRWRRNIGDVGYASDQSSNPVVHPGLVRWQERGDLGSMGNSVLQPVLLNEWLYAANARGKMLKMKPDSGEQQWRVDTGVTLTGGLGAGGGLILSGGEKGEVLAYGEDGKLRWKSVVSSEVLGPPAFADGIVVVRSGDGRIAGLNAADGKRKWLFEHATPALTVRSSAGVTIRNGTIFAGFAGGKLAAISLATGNLKWEATLSEPRGTTELERISDITSPPQADDEVVCAASFQGRIGCFNVAQGNLLWSREFSSDKGIAIGGRFVYAVNADGELFAMDKNNGSSAWKNAQLTGRGVVAPRVLGEYLIVGDKQGYLYAFSRDDGSLVARLATDGSAIPSAPIELGGGLLVQTYIGGLYSATLH